MPGHYRFFMLFLLACVSPTLLSGCGLWRKTENPLDQIGLPGQPITRVANETKPNSRQAKIDLLLALAQNDEKDGQHLAAAKKYQEVLEIERHPRAVHRSAILALRLEDANKAESLFAESLAADPNNVELLADLAYWKYLQGQLDEAEGFVRRALTKDPYSPRARNHLGLILAQQGKTDAAIREFELAGCDRSQALSNARHAVASAGPARQAAARVAERANPAMSGVTKVTGYSTK